VLVSITIRPFAPCCAISAATAASAMALGKEVISICAPFATAPTVARGLPPARLSAARCAVSGS